MTRLQAGARICSRGSTWRVSSLQSHPMTPEDRAATENRAERCLRRGEWSEALALYESVARAFPADSAAQRRVQQVRESIDPEELARSSPSATAHIPVSDSPASTPEAEGERLFALGDFAGAAAAYRQALREKPHSELIKERLIELYQLAQVSPRNPAPGTPAAAPSAAPARPAAPAPTRPTAPARAAGHRGTTELHPGASVQRAPSAATLPDAPEARLKALLERITSRRR